MLTTSCYAARHEHRASTYGPYDYFGEFGDILGAMKNLNLRTVADQTTAVLRYNNSMQYVSDVLGYARSY